MIVALRIYCQTKKASQNAVAIIHLRGGIVQGQNGDSEVNEKRSDLGLILKAKAKGFLNRIKPKYERNAAVEGDSHNFTMSKPNIIGI